MTVRDALIDVAKNLPEKCTWNDVLYMIYVRKQIEAGLKDEADRRLIPHHRVFAKYGKKKTRKP